MGRGGKEVMGPLSLSCEREASGNCAPFLQTAIDNSLSLMVLLFGLGFIAACLKSDLEWPKSMGKAFSFDLMLAIGFKGSDHS
jgi:hypothetical protein